MYVSDQEANIIPLIIKTLKYRYDYWKFPKYSYL